jgi:hypothetical protein
MTKGVENWRDDYGDDLDVERLREIFAPPDRFRVSEFKYPAATVTSGAMLPGKCFGFFGSVTFWFGDNSIRVDEGKFVVLPGGSYRLQVDGEVDARVVIVWEIPTE